MHHDPEVEAENRILDVLNWGTLPAVRLLGLKHDSELLLETTSEAIKLVFTDQLLDGLLVRLEEYHEWLENFLP